MIDDLKRDLKTITESLEIMKLEMDAIADKKFPESSALASERLLTVQIKVAQLQNKIQWRTKENGVPICAKKPSYA